MNDSILRKSGNSLLQLFLDSDATETVSEIVGQLNEGPAPEFDFGEFDSELTHPVVIHDDCLNWLRHQNDFSIEAVVTDPPYGLLEYSQVQQEKLRNGRGGVWRIPPSFDGHKRSPLPRFTTLGEEELGRLEDFFTLGVGPCCRFWYQGRM